MGLGHKLCFALYIRIHISWSRLLHRVGKFAYLKTVGN